MGFEEKILSCIPNSNLEEDHKRLILDFLFEGGFIIMDFREIFGP